MPTDLTIEESADFLNVSVAYVTRLIAQGELPSRPEGAEKLVNVEALIEYRDATTRNQKRLLDELTRLGQETGP